MSQTKRKFSEEEKLKILEETKTHGIKVTLEKHSLYPATFYSWRKNMNRRAKRAFATASKRYSTNAGR